MNSQYINRKDSMIDNVMPWLNFQFLLLNEAHNMIRLSIDQYHLRYDIPKSPYIPSASFSYSKLEKSIIHLFASELMELLTATLLKANIFA